MNGPDLPLPAPLEAAPLPEVTNHTPWPSQYFQHVDPFDEIFHVMVCRTTYRLAQRGGADGEAFEPVLLPPGEQPPLCEADQYRAAINASSVIQESDLAPYKPKCDVLVVNARAYSPKGRPSARWQAGFGFGEAIRKVFQVTGPRERTKGLLGWQLSAPEPVTQVPIVYELAFGGPNTVSAQQALDELAAAPHLGPAEEARVAQAIEELPEHAPNNPIGRGRDPEPLLRALEGVRALLEAQRGLDWAQVQRTYRAAPQIEALDTPFTGQADYPVVGLGPMGRWWQPRLALTGTHGEAWKATQWPRSPRDHDYRYWNCAPEDQQIAYPQGGETVALIHLTPPAGSGGDTMRFALPRQDLQLLLRLSAGPLLFAPMHIDTVIIDPEAATLTVVRRATVSARTGLRALELGTWPPGTRASLAPERPHGR